MKISDFKQVTILHGKINSVQQNIEKYKNALVNLGTEECFINIGGWPNHLDATDTFSKNC